MRARVVSRFSSTDAVGGMGGTLVNRLCRTARSYWTLIALPPILQENETNREEKTMTRPTLDRRGLMRAGAALGLAGLATIPGRARAAGFPEAPVRIFVGAAPGGPSDLLARLYATAGNARTGQAFVVENKPGAGGVIAAGEFARTAADGHTLMVGGPGALIGARFLMDKVPFDTTADFEPLTMLGAGGFVMVASPKWKAHTVAEFVAEAKARREPIFMGSGGNGSSGHLCGGAFAEATGMRFEHIPYQGDARGFADLLAGQIDLMFTAPNLPAPYVGTPACKVLGVTSRTRMSGFAGTPTIDEAGVPGFEYLGWLMLMARTGTPSDRIATLRGVWDKAMADASVGEKLGGIGMLTPEAYRNPVVLKDFLASETERTRKLIALLDIKPG
jgi:tripartite-type tricarboxylate transporter receptor subunit TctC